MTGQMDRRRFVVGLTEVALDQVVAGEVGVLRDPPGRRPAADVVARADWFATLDTDDQSMVADVMRETAYAALHTVLVVLDGATAITEEPSAGRLELLWHEDEVTVLTDPGDGPDLHDLLAETQGR